MQTTISRGWRPGLVGDVTRLHGIHYARDWGFDVRFESKVAAELADLFARYDAKRDLALFADQPDGTLAGAIVIDGTGPAIGADEVRLRFFIVSDGVRGGGLGRRLMSEALAFVRESGVARCWLTTFAGLDAARRLYETNGFRLVEDAEDTTWGPVMREQRFVLDLV